MKRRVIALILCTMLVSVSAMPVFAAENVGDKNGTVVGSVDGLSVDDQAESPSDEAAEADAKGGEAAEAGEAGIAGTDAVDEAAQAVEAAEAAGADDAGIAALSEDETAYDAVGTQIATEEDLRKALGQSGKYVMAEDIELEDTNALSIGQSVELDLGGHTLTSAATTAFLIGEEGDFKISNGTVQVPATMFYIYPGGKLTIDKGEYLANRFVTNVGGSLTINDGTFKSSSGYCFYLYDDSESYFYGGDIEAQSGIAIMNEPIATVETSSNLSKYSNYTDKKYKLTEEEYNTPTKLVWGKIGTEGPNLTVQWAALYGNFWYSETDITINSGKIVSKEDTAIYHPQQGKFTMNGGYIEGASAIEAKMGDFTFNGGYVVGNGEAASDQGSYEDILGGTTANGTALKYELYYYGATDTDEGLGARGPAHAQAAAGGYTHLPRNNDFSLTITDGVFISKNNAPITIKNWNMCTQEVSYDITGGRFSGFPKTIEMKHAEGDKINAYGIPVCDTVDTVYNYLTSGDYKFAPAAYYDGVSLQYGFAASDAAYYASMADAIADRSNDPDARAYIYYLLRNGLPENGKINEQLQIFYNLGEYCGKYIPENIGMGTDQAVFGYSFDPAGVEFDPNQYVWTDNTGKYALWSPAVTYDANGGKFSDGKTAIPVLATTASGLFEGNGYGYVVKESDGKSYVTLDEGGDVIVTPDGTVLVIPEDPTNGTMKFLGWYYEDGTPFDPAVTQIKANMTVYAKWEQSASPDTPKPTDTQKPAQAAQVNKSVKTGDENPVMAIVVVMAAAVCAIGGCMVRRRVRR